ncbi:MAG: phosphate acyltransferase PlsX [Sphingopyxis sp.]
MTREPRIAIDAMGGDVGVRVMIAGAALAHIRHPHVRYLLVGDRVRIERGLDEHPELRGICDILHTEQIVSGDDKPSREALRSARETSMGRAIDAVKHGEAGAALSSGNTGMLMAMAKMALRTMPGIDRPALAAMLPTLGQNDVVMLDLGANTECDANNLVEFALMGAAYARTAMGVARPRVALLNIGTEAQKGIDSVRDAASRLREASELSMEFCGFIEGDKLSRGEVDVVVHDGFSGNIALKTIEGTARFVTDLLRRAFTSSIRSKFGFLISRPATELLRHHLDPNNHNGAVFLGLNGVVLKSHGSANEKGVANAIHVCAELLEKDILGQVQHDLAGLHRGPAPTMRSDD